MLQYPRNIDYYNAERRSNRVICVMFTKDGSSDITSYINELAAENKKVQFLCVNTSLPKWEKLSDADNIRVFPTFKFYKDRVLVARVNGAQEKKVCETTRKLSFNRSAI